LPVVAIEVALLAQVINYIDILPISIITWGVLRMISGTESYLLEYKDSADKGQ
jgi:MscS family membrane protein